MWGIHGRKGLILKSLLAIIIGILLFAGYYLIFVKKTPEPESSKMTSSSTAQAAGPATVENVVKEPIKKALATSDYASYQNLQRTIALQYYYNNDTGNAERVMNDVFKNVPAGKVVSASYIMMASIQEKKHDIDLQKKYLRLAIDKLNAEGNSSQAENEQKVLDNLK